MIIINGIDFTSNVQEKSYKVDSHDVYSEWTDADERKHRYVPRSRILGSFNMVFVEGMGKTYNEFLEAIESAKSNGELILTVSVNNLDTAKEIYAFYSIDFQPPVKISDSRTFRKCTVKIEEC